MLPVWVTNWFSASGVLAEALITLLFSGCLLTASPGCRFYMVGGGEAGLGYRSESKVFAYHQAEEGNTAAADSSTELAEPVINALFDKDEPETPALVPQPQPPVIVVPK